MIHTHIEISKQSLVEIVLITLQQKLAPSVDPSMALGKAKLVGISLLAHPRLLQQCPVPPLGCCCCTSTQTPYPVNQATSLIPHPLNTEPPPNLSSENGQLPLLTPPPQSFPALERLHMLQPRRGQVVNQNMHILRHLAPSTKNPSPLS